MKKLPNKYYKSKLVIASIFEQTFSRFFSPSCRFCSAALTSGKWRQNPRCCFRCHGRRWRCWGCCAPASPAPFGRGTFLSARRRSPAGTWRTSDGCVHCKKITFEYLNFSETLFWFDSTLRLWCIRINLFLVYNIFLLKLLFFFTATISKL